MPRSSGVSTLLEILVINDVEWLEGIYHSVFQPFLRF